MSLHIPVIRHEELSALAIALTVITKFNTSMAFYVVNLLSVETYPTCLRQTGISVGAIAANIFGIFGPYIVYLV